jgi:hypothetical protein
MFVLRTLIRQRKAHRRPASRSKRMSSSLSVEALESRQLLHGGVTHTHAPMPGSLGPGATERQALPTQAARETARDTARRLTGALQAQLMAGPVADLNAGRINADGFVAGATGLVGRFKQDVDEQLLPTHPRVAARLKSQADQLLADLVTQVRQHDEGRLALHIHPHLTIMINGRPLTIPANIGITPRGAGPVHTHDDSGTIHVESEVLRTFYLKDFFRAWGRTFTPRNLLGYRADAAHEITMTVNGQPSTEFGDLVLRDRDEIVLSYGPR